jgi:hypothetical protein
LIFGAFGGVLYLVLLATLILAQDDIDITIVMIFDGQFALTTVIPFILAPSPRDLPQTPCPRCDVRFGRSVELVA